MASAAVTRLRVAQAARTPVGLDQIVHLLAQDDEAQNLSVEKVREVMSEWIDLGIVEELSPGRYLHTQIFKDDVQRRLVAQLARPRNVASLGNELRQDPTVGMFSESQLGEMLGDVVDAGLVVRLPEHEESSQLVRAAQQHKDAITMPDERAEGLVDRLDAPHRRWELVGPQYVMTELAHEALQVT